MPRSAVFLDRDGVLIPDIGYPHAIADAVLFPDVLPALRQIQRCGYILLVVSNQSGIGRGLFTLADVENFNSAITRQLEQGGIALPLENFYVCPHAPNDDCDCRKPKPGLLLRAAHDHSIDLTQSYLVGDKETDIQAGRAASVRTVLLDRGHKALRTEAERVAFTLVEAADFITRAHSMQIETETPTRQE
jgi:D-glycero-D-manno-heptose 1,7-bisphosphate phosphatase